MLKWFCDFITLTEFNTSCSNAKCEQCTIPPRISCSGLFLVWKRELDWSDKSSVSPTCAFCRLMVKVNKWKDTPGEMSRRLALSEQHGVWFWLSRAAALMPWEQRELSAIFQCLSGALHAGKATERSRLL